MKPTSRDLAAQLGVSQSTVSRALRNDPRVSLKTRQRVADLAMRSGYTPNAVARSLSTRRTGQVALVVSDITNPFYPDLVEALQREFGLLEIHSRTQSDVLAAGEAVLAYLGLKESDRLRPTIASSQFVTNVNPYQAQLINKWRKGNLLLPRSSLFVLEATPAAYVTLAANEAEKAANISLIEIRAVGRFGRMFISGTESEVQSASEAAIAALTELGGAE
jgi:transcriptional regulator with XRE-family HTH domain